jgi:hypothetical protein
VGLTCGFIPTLATSGPGIRTGFARFSSVLMRPQWPQMALTCGSSPLAAPVRVADCRKLPARILGSNAPGEQISALTCTVTSEHALEETYSRRDSPLTHLNQRRRTGIGTVKAATWEPGARQHLASKRNRILGQKLPEADGWPRRPLSPAHGFVLAGFNVGPPFPRTPVRFESESVHQGASEGHCVSSTLSGPFQR